MSRQFDEAMEGRFDLYGKEYRLIEPENIEELMQALEVKSALETHISGLMHDEDSSGYQSFKLCLLRIKFFKLRGKRPFNCIKAALCVKVCLSYL